MLSFFKRREAEVLTHWYALVTDFNMPTDDFYKLIEEELATRAVPGLQHSRVEFSEGGLLSHNRSYLRLVRERFVFDICAAPFGTSYFFSLRFAELNPTVSIFELLALIIIMAFSFGFLVHFAGYVSGSFCFVLLVMGIVWFLQNAVRLGAVGLESDLLAIPVIGPFYDRYLRKSTYYRVDTRLMYLSLVDELVKQRAQEVTVAKGVKLLRIRENSPILNELYKPATIPTPESSKPA